MIRNICLIGSTGFIGNQVYNDLNLIKDIKVFRFSSRDKKFIDKCDLSSFDCLIFAAGIHPDQKNDSKKIFLENKKIIRNSSYFFFNSKSVIFISSFKTSIDINKKVIKSSNKYNYYKYDNNYGKSKIILEKIFIKFCKKYNKKFTIISPSHVIGPSDKKLSPNGFFFKSVLNKKIIFFPDCYISIVDVRNISTFIINLIMKNLINNNKIVLNDKSLLISDYIKYIKKDNKFYIKLKINFYLILLISKITSFFNKEIISNNRLNYLKHNPITEIHKYKKNFNFKDTIDDTRQYLLKKN